MRKYILIVFTFTLLAALSGCARPQTTQAPPAADGGNSSEQKLVFSVLEAEVPGFTVVPREELGGTTDASITYCGLSEVAVSVDGADIPLAEAIRGGLTVPEIFAFARMDARNGFCTQTYRSERGLTHFSYTYPECVLCLAYDVYETPDGAQTLIEEICICGTDGADNLTYTYVDEESKWGYFLDREDWGLTFEISRVCPTRITLDCTQHGGQQIGKLFIDGYMLFSMEDDGSPDNALPGYIGRAGEDAEGLPIPIAPDASGPITVDWSATVGTLTPGKYCLKLDISDVYEESEVHPLMRNYYDRQSYHIEFSVT